MYEVIGVRRTAGTSKKTGRPYSGYTVFYTYLDQEVIGVKADNEFLSDTILNGYIPKPGDHVDLIYDRNGFLIKFSVVA
ncbi:MAG: hypothetical protein J6Q53_00700 [Oscillospiraceae bacterium]|nr:hypothetical protein [Oscillospiraceae bacterium]